MSFEDNDKGKHEEEIGMAAHEIHRLEAEVARLNSMHRTRDGLPCPGTCVGMAGELEDLRAEVKELKAKTYCAYCHEEFPLDTATAKQVTEHVRTCEQHPMRALEAEVERQKRQLADAQEENERLENLLDAEDGGKYGRGTS